MNSNARHERWIAFAMILPSIILLAIFVYGFIGWTGLVSVSKWDGIQPDYTFVGLDNYRQLFSRVAGGIAATRFYTGLWNTFFFTIFFLLLCVGFGLLLAILLDQSASMNDNPQGMLEPDRSKSKFMNNRPTFPLSVWKGKQRTMS